MAGLQVALVSSRSPSESRWPPARLHCGVDLSVLWRVYVTISRPAAAWRRTNQSDSARRSGRRADVYWRLCEPRIFREIRTVDKEQLLICVVTIAVTLFTTDPDWVTIGMLTKLVLLGVQLLWGAIAQLGRVSMRLVY